MLGGGDCQLHAPPAFSRDGDSAPCHVICIRSTREREDVVAAEIAHDKKESMFIISTRTEKQISRGYAIWWWVLVVLGLAIAIGCGAWRMIITQQANVYDWHPMLWMGVGYIAALVLIWVWTTYNSLINLSQRVKQGWSQVDVQLKRRNDLIPNLVQAVEGYRGHERETQTMVAELRQQMEATPLALRGQTSREWRRCCELSANGTRSLKPTSRFLNYSKLWQIRKTASP